MYPYREMVRTYRCLYGLSTRLDDPETLTSQSTGTNNAPRDPICVPITILSDVYLARPTALWIFYHPTYNFHPEDPLEADYVPLGLLIAELTRMMFALLSNKKRKLMDGVAFLLFVPTKIARHGGI